MEKTKKTEKPSLNMQRNAYQITINNPEVNGFSHIIIKKALIENFSTLRYFCMADEIGEQGTYHTHVYVYFNPRRAPLWPAPSGTCPFYSRLSRRSPPAPAPCRYPAARPLHLPAACGQRAGFSGCPLETYRFWTSGHCGPKDCPARYPRP